MGAFYCYRVSVCGSLSYAYFISIDFLSHNITWCMIIYYIFIQYTPTNILLKTNLKRVLLRSLTKKKKIFVNMVQLIDLI